MSIATLLKAAAQERVLLDFPVQIQTTREKETKNGKPFLEWQVADATGSFSLKIWENHSQFQACSTKKAEDCLLLSGSWSLGSYGLESSDWHFSELSEKDLRSFFSGDEALQEKQANDFAHLERLLATVRDPRLAALNALFLQQYGDRFQRSAAARKNHHARRGGLVEHVATMMRLAESILPVYPHLNSDLLYSAILFHDCGKLWENSYPEQGFSQLPNLAGEMLGHIPLGIELVNKLWRDLNLSPYEEMSPSSDLVRLHLLHLIASHHGQYDFGSPTLPRTAEAHALHYLDNLDAKMEMVSQAYATAPEIAPGVQERQFPLPANLVAPLPKVTTETA